MYQYHPRHIHHHFLRNLHIPTVLSGIIIVTSVLSLSTFVFASATANFRIVINPGVLAVNVVDSAFVAISQPLVDMGQVFQAASCQSVNGTFGTVSQKIYIRNPDVADGGWNVTLSAASPTTQWSSGNGHFFDFNDPTTTGCGDGVDSDTVAGQMTVNPSSFGSNLSQGQCTLSCNTTDVAKGSIASFEEGTRNAITLLSGASGSSDMGDWVLTGVTIQQTIPVNQTPADEYSLNLYLSVTAT